MYTPRTLAKAAIGWIKENADRWDPCNHHTSYNTHDFGGVVDLLLDADPEVYEESEIYVYDVPAILGLDGSQWYQINHMRNTLEDLEHWYTVYFCDGSKDYEITHYPRMWD